MDYSKGFSASYYASYVDPDSWRDIERIEMTDGSVNRTTSELRATATINCTRYPKNTERWVRIYLDAKQGAESVHIPLFTGLATSPSDDINGTYIENSVDCYSVLKPVEDVLLDRGWYAPVEVPSGSLIRNLLAPSPAPVVIADNSPTLTEAIIAEDNESNLSMIDKILTATGWRMRLAGDGTIQILPKASESMTVFDAIDFDVVEPELEIERDWYKCPNVFRAVSGGLTAIARDDSPTSYLSTVSRGREVWKEETDCNLNAGEGIAEYAMRRLKEEQQVDITAKYKRRYFPDIYPSDIVTLHYPEINLQGDYFVTSQNIELGYGATTSEEVTSL